MSPCPDCHDRGCIPNDEQDGKMKPCPNPLHQPYPPEGMDDLYRELGR